MRQLYISFIALFTLASVVASAQPIRKSSYEGMIATAEEQLAKKDYYNALEWYEKAYDESEDITLNPIIANLQYQLRDYAKAERAFARLYRKEKEAEQYTEQLFPYGRTLKMVGKYAEAIEALQKYIEKGSDEKNIELAKAELTGAQLALDVSAGSGGLKVENLGKTINGNLSEYSPYYYGNDELYFTAFDAKEVIIVDESANDYHSKIYRSVKKEKDKDWEKPTPLDESINRVGFHHTNLAFSPDGRYMFFVRAGLDGALQTEGKLYFSIRGDDWGAAQEVTGINGDYVIKQPAVGELFGKEVLIFSSNMDGGFGGYDLFYATRKGEGVYSDPVNLGPKINTVGDEETPFFFNNTLYYSSTGLPGYGGFDIFFTTWNGDRWKEPANMGLAYNTSVDDKYFSLDKTGYNGLLTSNREGGRSAKSKTCCDDIYSFAIPSRFVELVAGVFDDKKKALTGGSVQLVEMVGKVPGQSTSQNQPDGNRFDFPLAFEKGYKIVATRDGYYPDSIEISTAGIDGSKTFQHRFFLKPMPKPVVINDPEYDTITIEEAFVLENILYDFDSDKITVQAEQDLQVIFELLQQYPDMRIELGSHTDARGDNKYNADLSQRRAESARRWLVNRDITRTRIEAKGYGESVPKTITAKVAAKYPFLKEGDVLTESFIDMLKTEEEKEAAHALNRRTEFKIIAGPTSIIVKRARLKKATGEVTPNRNFQPAKTDSNDIKISKLSSLHALPKDSLQGLPIMHFEKRFEQLGNVKQGETRELLFPFVNKGETPLIISIATACSCTTLEYERGVEIKPGQQSVLKATFDSTTKTLGEIIDIDIILENTTPNGMPIIERLQYQFEIVK